MKKNIVVIGCGNIGRRHVEGLGLSASKIKVHVFDINPNAIAVSKDFFRSNSYKISNLEIQFYSKIQEIGKAVSLFDLV